MNLFSYLRIKGTAQTLRKLGYKKEALQFLKAKALQENVVQSQGIIKFSERPKTTQTKLNNASLILGHVNTIIWKNRKQNVST